MVDGWIGRFALYIATSLSINLLYYYVANRISLLKVEEQKALHKVVETKERADEILK